MGEWSVITLNTYANVFSYNLLFMQMCCYVCKVYLVLYEEVNLVSMNSFCAVVVL